MQDEKANRMGVVGVASRGLGMSVGAVAATGVKIGGFAARGMAALGGLLRDRKSENESLVSDLEKAGDEFHETIARESAVRAQVAARESDPTALQRELQMPRGGKNDAKSELSQDSGAVRTEEQTALSDGNEPKAPAEPVEAVAAEAEQRGPGPQIPETETPGHPDVRPNEVQAAVFRSEADGIIFARARCEMASHEAAARADAARAMAGVRHELSVRALAGQMGRDPSTKVRRECVKALAKLEMQEGLPAIERALGDQAPSVRLAAVWALYRLAGVRGAAALTRMVSDEDGEIRRRVATCIGWLGQEELATALLPLLADSRVSVRRAAVEAMGTLRSRKVVSALIRRLGDPDESIRKAVLGAIEAITGKEMSTRLPADEKRLPRLIARWQQWWKEEYLG